MNTQLKTLKPGVTVHRDPSTGIAWVKSPDGEHACHPWYDKTPTKFDLKRFGWGPKDRLIRANGHNYNTSLFNAPNELDKIAAKECQCGGRHEQTAREKQLMPGGVPRYVHCYDDGGDGDRYTIVFTGRYRHNTGGGVWYLGVTEYGSYNHGESDKPIDYPSYKHLGKKVKFESLPEPVQATVRQNYRYLWSLPGGGDR